jgi:hypothetical protein
MTQITNPLTSIGYKVSTIEDIRNHAPAVFSGNESPKLSDRYSFVPTYDLITALEKTGWLPSHVKQNGKGQFSRHVVRFTNPNLGFDFFNLKGDNVKPQFLVDNSHNGGSPTMGHMGLFRLVCANGLVVAMPGMYTSIKLRHIGIDFDELKQLTKICQGSGLIGINSYASTASRARRITSFLKKLNIVNLFLGVWSTPLMFIFK